MKHEKITERILSISKKYEDSKNKVSIYREQLDKEYRKLDDAYVKGNLALTGIKNDLEVDETKKTDSIKWKIAFEKYVKGKKEDFNVVVKKLTKKCSVWEKRNWRVIEHNATKKGCRHVLHSHSVVGAKVK